MKKILYLLFVVVAMSSCGVKYASIPYFTNLPPDSVIQEHITNQANLRIQKNDVLALTVNSLSEEASAIFNLGSTSSLQGNPAGSNNPNNTANGFLVDINGEIQLPYLGSVKVEGLTTAEARKSLEAMLVKYLKVPVVGLRIVNFRVTVLGDVGRPGVYPIMNERATLAEAFSLAGDLSITAMRNNILLVREEAGKREYIRLDIQNKDFFNSPYFYLKNNDLLYVQPGPAKYATINQGYRNIGLILSAISVIGLVLSRL
ncbi:MAG: polysaccharide export protein [Pedobacter sp.]|nr:MAG: polysaccharide export protein [Pedobacter sp.]